MAPCQTEFSEACLESSGVHAVACPESAFSVLISIGPGSGCSTELRTLSVHTGVALIHNSRALVPHRSESIHKDVHSWGQTHPSYPHPRDPPPRAALPPPP